MNIYIQQISSVCLQNKYTKWYCNIISKRLQDFSCKDQAKDVLGYCEGHHILPKGFKMGGETDKDNIVYLSAREHFLVHMLLVKMVEGNLKYRMSASLTKMNLKDSINSRTYQTAKILNSKYSHNKLEETQIKKRSTNLKKYGVINVRCTEKAKINAIEITLEKYGVSRPFQSNEIQKKVKTTNLENFGVEYLLQSPEIREKCRTTNLERYGFEYAQQNTIMRAKVTEANIERFGGNCPMSSPVVRSKFRATNLEKYGFEYPMQSKEIKEKRKSSNLEKYGLEHPMQTADNKKRISESNKGRKTICDPLNNYKQKRVKEKEVETYLDNGWIKIDARVECSCCGRKDVLIKHVLKCCGEET